MIDTSGKVYTFILRSEDDTLKRYLQGILNEYHLTAYPEMRVPESKKITIQVTDEAGNQVGGAILWAYWGWLEISILALEASVRGQGVGRRLMSYIEDLALNEGCHHLRVDAFEQEASFYQHLGYRAVGKLEDFPAGYCYYFMRKDLSTV